MRAKRAGNVDVLKWLKLGKTLQSRGLKGTLDHVWTLDPVQQSRLERKN